jgi:hypothetical protein
LSWRTCSADAHAPLIVPQLVLRPRADPDPHEDIEFYLRNDGRGLAKYAGFHCRFSGDLLVVNCTRPVLDATALNNGAPVVGYQDDAAALHPNNVNTRVGTVTIRRDAKGTPLAFTIRYYCEGMMARDLAASVTPE